MSTVEEPEVDAAPAAPKLLADHPNGDVVTSAEDIAVGEPAGSEEGESISLETGEVPERSDEDILDGETEEETLQRRIEEGKIGKGKTLRRWKNTEAKQREVETGRNESKVQRYDQIYEEVRALRKETRHSVQDLRERFKKQGVIQNKDQFIVRLIAQERNEQEGKVAAIKSLQQWRLTDVELHNFLNRCHKKGLDGKLDLAMQWAYEQETAGGEVNFKEGLAFYSSIGILQPRSSAQTQQQWREWREWEDAMTAAIEKRNARGSAVDPAAARNENGTETGPDICNEDSTVCNSPWSSERGGGGGSFGGSMRTSSSHGEGDAAGGYGSSRIFAAGVAALSGTAPEPLSSGPPRLRRGRTPAGRESPRHKRGWWQWRSYSPPGPVARRKSEEVRRAGSETKAPTATEQQTVESEGEARGGSVIRADAGSNDPLPDEVCLIAPGTATAAAAAFCSNGSPIPLPLLLDHPDGGAGRPGEYVVRASGGYLPPRHRLANLHVSPTNTPRSHADGAAETISSAGQEPSRPGCASRANSGISDSNSGDRLSVDADKLGALSTPQRRAATARGLAKTRAKGPAGGGTPKQDSEEAPTEELGLDTSRKRGFGRSPYGRTSSLSGVLSDLAEWLMPGMEGRRRAGSEEEARPSPHKSAPSTPAGRGTRSAPVTPRGRPKSFAVLREGGWFYNGDSDYSSSDEAEGEEEKDDEKFWEGGKGDPQVSDGGGSMSILERLRKLFTL